MDNNTQLIKVPFAKDPVNLGFYDELVAQGITSFGIMNRVNRYGCEWESLVDNNTDAPAVWDGGDTITPSENWKLNAGNPEAWLMNHDKPATSEQYPFNGMGRFRLQKNLVEVEEGGETVTKNLLTQAMFEDGDGNPLTNTVFIIQYDYVLSEDITVPANCVLEFDGGSLTGESLTGEVYIKSMPDNLFELVDCSALNITSMKHLVYGDIKDTIDSSVADGTMSQRCEQNLKSLNKFYSVKGLSKIYAIGIHEKRPSLRLMFYDENFFSINITSWSYVQYGVVVPENAAYVNLWLSFDCTDIADIPNILPYIYTNFLDNESIYINSDFTRDNKGNVKDYYNIDVTDLTNVYIAGFTQEVEYGMYKQLPRNNDEYKMICIPYSLFKGFDYICIKPRQNQVSKVHFLKIEPKENNFKLLDNNINYYSDYYKKSTGVNAGSEPIFLPIMPDTKYIMVLALSGGTIFTPEYVRLYTKENLDLDCLDVDNRLSSLARNTNIRSINIMHWNIGNFSHGGSHSSIDDSNYNSKRSAFRTFLDKYKGYNKLLNEYNPTFASYQGNNVSAIPIFEPYYTNKILPRTNSTDNLAAFALDGLAGYSMWQITSFRGGINTEGDPQPPKPYVIYRYFLGNGSLYIVHTHLPTNMTATLRDAAFNDILNAVSGYYNVIIIGDFNISSASALSVLTNAGYTIANGSNPDKTWVKWNHETETPDISGITETVDWCVYKGDISIENFHVCTDATDPNVPAGETGYGNMLSDHWPIAFTVNYTSTNSVVPDEKGSLKYDPTEKAYSWFDGTRWINPAQNILYKTLTDMRTFVPGIYRVASGSAIDNLLHNDELPNSLLANKAGFILIVDGFSDTGSVSAVLIPNNTGVIYTAIKSTNGERYANWRAYAGYPDSYDSYKRIGTTAERPGLSGKPWEIGLFYFDTDLGKPIWYKERRSSVDIWVDATGAEV